MVSRRALEILFFIYFTELINCESLRSYDIEEMCMKTYHEDLNTVLHRFRRTPDYIKILEGKMADFYTHVGDMKNQITYYLLENQTLEVKDVLGLEDEEFGDKEGSTAFYRTRAITLGYLKTFLRSEVNKSKIERLDSYPKLNSVLSVSQRNSMRDLGFKYAKRIIQVLIKNMLRQGKFTRGIKTGRDRKALRGRRVTKPGVKAAYPKKTYKTGRHSKRTPKRQKNKKTGKMYKNSASSNEDPIRGADKKQFKSYYIDMLRVLPNKLRNNKENKFTTSAVTPVQVGRHSLVKN